MPEILLLRVTAAAVLVLALLILTRDEPVVYARVDRTPGSIGSLANDDRGEPWGNRGIADPERDVRVATGVVTRTDALVPFDETLRIGPQDYGRVFDETPVRCHGGLLRIQWHLGNLEGVTEYTGIHLGIEFDGQLLATAIKGVPDRTHVDDIVNVLATVECSPGSHVVGLRITHVTGAWGFPYVANPGDAPGGQARAPRLHPRRGARQGFVTALSVTSRPCLRRCPVVANGVLGRCAVSSPTMHDRVRPGSRSRGSACRRWLTGRQRSRWRRKWSTSDK